MLLDINDAPEKSIRIFGQLIDIFEEQSINPTPLNYFIWYEYYKGDNPKFRQEMDKILNDPFGYNDRLGRRLYDEYFADDDSADNEFDKALKRLIGLVIKKMNIWSDKLAQQSKELDKFATSLNDPNIDAATLKELTHTVQSTVTSMQESSADLQKELMSSNEEITRLRKQLIEARAQVMLDELTEVGNRKAFNIAMAEMMDSAQASGNPESLVLIMTDIDHFKRFNDNFGHLVGDSVLRYFANLMKKSKLENETICRYGGEEFAVILSDSDMESAMERAESIRHNIETAKLKRKDSTKELGLITASFGIATYKGLEETVDEFIKRADDALYLAKEQGRNQVKTELDLEAQQTASAE
ncbi:GGDEF domain-containing protein [Hydrogenovibrio sp. JE_KL2]|uniref:GGDEF domain-containing protein n=1 Tax=Hydrogenovibrio sp. JE_KL2 TaxID=2651188 RepID=UPI00128C8A56|nr:GGDEF domain-containing protein [Hydrogenovibrio sp. JE_KL2]MPQ77340.1 GGDEF domain-containing protein [Hydrogenovibrio sp. JE_KL2]